MFGNDHSVFTAAALGLGLWMGLAAPPALAQSSEAPEGVIEGFTEPYRDVDLAAPEMGVLETILAREGQRVVQGELLAELEADVLKASLDIARQTMESAGRLESAQEELDFQEQWLEKLRELQQRDHASSQEVERVVSQRAIAAARLKSVEEEIAVRRLEHRRIEIQLQQRRMNSPLAGVVTQIFKDQGEFVSPTDPIVLKIVQLDPLKIVFPAPLSVAVQLQTDQKVRIQLDGVAETATGVIEFISPTPDAQSRTTRVVVRLPNPGERLPCGAACKLLDVVGGLANANH